MYLSMLYLQTAPLKLLNGGVPVPATLSQKIAANSGAQKNVDIRGSFGQRVGGLDRRQPGLGSKLASEASGKISKDSVPSPSLSTLGQEQRLLEVELHPEERLGVLN